MDKLNEFHRCYIDEVEEIRDDGHRLQQVLKVRYAWRSPLNVNNDHPLLPMENGIKISGIWYGYKLARFDSVNIQSDEFDQSDSTYLVDGEKGFLTVDPDNSIPVELLSKSRKCMRQAWLEGLFKPVNQTLDQSGILKLIIRDILKIACTEHPKNLQQLKTIKERCLEKESILSKCSTAMISREKLAKKVNAYLPGIMSWLKKYVLDGSDALDDGDLKVGVDSVDDIEEIYRSPCLGIEGKIDARCNITFYSQPPTKKSLPLVFGIGGSASHDYRLEKDQLISYSMTTEKRSSGQSDGGILLRILDEDVEDSLRMNLVKFDRQEKVNLLKRRNDLANLLSKHRKDFKSPEFISSNEESLCKDCTQRFNCSLMAESFERDKILRSSSFRRELIDSELSHLDRKDIWLFSRWLPLIDANERAHLLQGKPWVESSDSRDARNLIFNYLRIDLEQSSFEKIVLRFAEGRSYDKGAKLLHHRVAVRQDNALIAAREPLIFGYLEKFEKNVLEVSVSQDYRNLMDGKKYYQLNLANFREAPSLYRQNLSSLMFKGSIQTRGDLQLLRSSIKHSKSAPNLKLEDISDPDQDQRRALDVLEQIGTYALIDMVPGSEKTIIDMITLLVKAKKSVLISSHDHGPLDNVLCRLKKSGVDFVRFGIISRVHSELLTYSIGDKIEKEKESVKTINLKEYYRKIKIAGATCQDVANDPLLMERRFDLCFIIEATKTPLPLILSPLLISKRFLLTNYKKQIVSIGESEKVDGSKVNGGSTEEGGHCAKDLEKNSEGSLFMVLREKTEVISLTYQYQMNREIMSHFNRIYYQNTLQCGSDEVASAVIPQANGSTGISWLDSVLSNDINRSVLFLNMDNSHELGDSYGTNSVEAFMCVRMVQELIRKCNIPAREIAISSFFETQASLLKEMMSKDGIEGISIGSNEEFQRGEKMVVIITSVWRVSDPTGMTEYADSLLSMASTRAARKLIFIGSRMALDKCETFHHFFNLLGEEQLLEVNQSHSSLKELVSPHCPWAIIH